MKLSDYIFKRLEDFGVSEVFCLPGESVQDLYRSLNESNLKSILLSHEPSVGYAADAYSRIKGLGVALVSYGVGSLNMVNAVSQAYAESSPLIVLSGGPGLKERAKHELLHHKVRTFKTQQNVYKEITEASFIIDSEKDAADKLEEAFHTALKYKKPVYIEVPRDLSNCQIHAQPFARPTEINLHDKGTLEEALKEVIHLLNNAKQPLILAGVEVGRIKMQDELLKLTEKMQIPIASTLLGKSVVSESHNLSLGTFFGNLSNERAKNYLQKSDCVLCLGAILSDVNLGMFTYEFDRNTLIESRIESLKVKHHEYTGITLEKLINGLLTDQTLKKHNIKLPKRVDAFEGLTIEKSKIKTQHVEILLNQFLNRSNSPTYRIVCDVGDCLFIGQGLHLNNISCFLSPAYYLSMGFAVPGGIGAQIAEPEKRPLILVGDGAFQMTGLELISATRLNLNPVVILLNNGSYATLENVELDSIPGSYAIGKYDYYKMAEIFGGIGLKCETTNAFELALKDIEGKYKDKMVIIQVDLEPDDCTEVLSSFGERMGKSNKDASQNS